MADQPLTTIAIRRPRADWLKWLAVVVVLLATHLATAWHYADRYARGIVATSLGTMSLDLTIDQWLQRHKGADSTIYLEVARNIADGQGVVWQEPNSNPPRNEPFYFWGPGTPAVLGAWLKVTGGRTMFTLFVFSVLCQLFFGVMALATLRLYTRSWLALLLTAFFSGYCPPLQERYFGVDLTSSELVGLIPLSLLFFVLSKAFIAYRSAPAGSWRSWFSRLTWRQPIVRQVAIWFAIAGLLFGWYSLTRDPGRMFATFVAGFIVLRAVLVDRRRLMPAMTAAMLVIVGTYAVRYPVQLWNKARCGQSTICSASEGSIWRYGLWMKHDQYAWYESCGIGFGEYLDPAAAGRVEAYFQQGKPRAMLYSLSQLAQAVAQRPADAVAFKVARIPVLWFATDMWPRSVWRWETKWCALMYLFMAGFVGVRLWKRKSVPEPFYLYILLICCAMPLIHFEFRYTFPAWHMLVLTPGLFATVVRRGRAGRLVIDGGDEVEAVSYPIVGAFVAAEQKRRLAA